MASSNSSDLQVWKIGWRQTGFYKSIYKDLYDYFKVGKSYT